jgi:hypothetical protein
MDVWHMEVWRVVTWWGVMIDAPVPAGAAVARLPRRAERAAEAAVMVDGCYTTACRIGGRLERRSVPCRTGTGKGWT